MRPLSSSISSSRLSFLQEDKVAADLRSGVVGKEVVRQTDCRDEVRLFEHFEPYRLVARGVHYALRRDELHDAAVVDGFGGRTSSSR